MIRTSLASVTNTDMTDSVWRQASLPVSKGGLGIRRTDELAIPAFLASVYSVQQLVCQIFSGADIDEAVMVPTQLWFTAANQTAIPLLPGIQKKWDSVLVDHLHQEMISSAVLEEKARLLAVSTKESGMWLNALPIPTLGNLLDNDALRVSIALRLGAKVCNPHRCRCGKNVDVHGRHGLSCKKSGGRYSRHASLNHIVQRALNSAQVPSILEPPGLERENGKRPDGLTQIPWKNGKHLVWDVTCVDTMAMSYIVGSMNSAGSAAAEAEKKKTRKYQQLVAGRFIFCPVAFETFGPWGPECKVFLTNVGKMIAERTGEMRASEFLRQRISIEIQRGNAACVLKTHQSGRNLDEVYYVLNSKR
jgi:hypothetical protein